MKSRKQKERKDSNSSSQQQQKFQEKKLSQFRDYISMRAHQNIANPKKKAPKKVQKHSIKMHAHLQPQAPEQQPIQLSDQQCDRDGDPSSLLVNFNNQNYNEWIKVMKERAITEKPYTQQDQQLLDTLALQNTNICIYGYGSKIQYLRNLTNSYLSDHYIWQINGYKLSLTDKKIYNHFGKFLIEAGVCSTCQKITKESQLEQYRQYLQQYKEKQLIVLFHCLDSINFLDPDSQMSLSQLFSLPRVRLICSIDNMKIATVWHPQVKTRYKFTFFNINTSVPNIHEQIFRPNTNDNRDLEDKAIMNIYQSLNNNQKRILKLFAKRQLENDNKQQPEYFTFDSLLDQCIDHIILSNDMQLRQNLLELLDHKVIVAADKKDGGAKKYYTIKCNKAMLDRIFKEKIED